MEETEDPFKAFGGQSTPKSIPVESDGDPFAEFGGKTLKKKSQSESSPIGGSSVETSSFQYTKPNDLLKKDSSFSVIPPGSSQKQKSTGNGIDFSRINLEDANDPNLQRQKLNENPRDVALREQDRKKVLTDQSAAIMKKQEDSWKSQHGNGYLSGVGLGLKYATSKVLSGASNVVPAMVYASDRINKMLTGQPLLDDQDKAEVIDKTTEAASMGVNKDYQGPDKIAGAVGGLLEFVPAALAAEGTGGASFYLNGVGNAYKEVQEAKKNGAKFENGSEDLYIQGKGITDYLLMSKLNAHSLFPTLPAELRNVASREASLEAIKGLAKSSEPLTSESLASAFKDSAIKMADNIKSKGVPFLKQLGKGYAKTSADLAALTTTDALLKKGSNALAGEENFKVEDGSVSQNIAHILTSDAPLFAAMGARENVGALFGKSPVRNEVVEALRRDSSPEAVDAIKQNVAQMGVDREWSQEDMDGTINHIDKIASAVNKIPKNLGDTNYNKALDIVLGKQQLQEQMSKVEEANKSLDPTLAEIGTPEQKALTAKLEQSDDKLRDIASGKKTKYFEDEEKGGYFKQLGGDGKPESISKDRFELEQVEQEARDIAKTNQENETAQEEPAVTGESADGEEVVTEGSGEEVRPGETEAKTETKASVEKDDFYHGSPIAGLKKLNNELAGSNTNVDSAKDGIWVTTNQKVAETFRDWKNPTEVGKTGEIYNTQIDVKKPLYVADTNEKGRTGAIKKAKEEGYDSVVFTDENGGKHILVFDPEKVTIKPKPNENNQPLPEKENVAPETIPEEGNQKSIKNDSQEDIKAKLESLREKNKFTHPLTHPEQHKEIKILQDELNRRERESIVRASTPDEALNVLDNLENQTTKNITPRDIKETRSVLEKYQNSDNLSDSEISEDFKDSLLKISKKITSSNTPHSVETMLNFSLKELLKRGVSKADILKVSEQEFKSKNYTEKEYTQKIENILSPLLDDTVEGKKNTNEPVEVKKESVLPDNDKPTGITKEETRKQREYRGEKELEAREKKTLNTMFEEGKKSVDGGEIDPRALAAEVSNKQRNISKEEVNALLYDRQRLKNQIDGLNERLDKAVTDGNQEQIEPLSKALLQLEHQRSLNELAVLGGANENALALTTMRNMIKADYSRSDQEARMRSKNNGVLTDDMRAEIKRYSDELEEANRKLKEYEDNRSAEKAKQEHLKEKRAIRDSKKTADKETLKKERKVIVDDFLAELKKIRTSTSAAAIPYARELAAAAPFMKKLLTNLTKEGIVEFKDVIDKIHEEFEQHISGLTKRDVMDAIAGVYNEVKQTKNELLSQRNAIIRLSKLTGKLEDLQNGIKTTDSPARTISRNKEIVALEKQIKELEDQSGDDVKSERERQRYIKSIQKDIDSLDQQIDNGEKLKRESNPKYAGDPEVDKLRQERDAKREELDKIDPSGKEAQRLKQAIKSTERSIEEYERKIKEKDLHPTRQVNEIDDAQLNELRKKRDDLSTEYKQLKKDEFTPQERGKQLLKNQLDRINKKIESGDFTRPEVKIKPELDDEAITLKARVRKAQNNFDAMAERLDRKQESKFNRALDTYSSINRMFLLSGVRTLGKLYSFASERAVSTPVEELINTMNSKLPGLRNIAERSPRYSGGLNIRAEAKAIAAKVSKASWKDTWEVLKNGNSELDMLYGKSGVDKDFQLNPSALEFFGRLHGAFKNTTKRAEFYRSYEKRLVYAAEHGKDINDPNVQFATGLEAYADGKRAILMHDNMMTDAYKSFLRTLESKGSWEGKTAATVFRTLLPIIKIPTNYALEAFDTATGGVRAVPYLLKAAIKGSESLTPAQATMVMRTMAKGQFGLGMMVLAYNNPQMFGGYYSGKRDDKDLKAGEVVIAGMHLPHFMTHHPIFEAMQIAATMRRAIDSANGNGDKEGVIEDLTAKNRDAIKALALPKIDPKLKEAQSVNVSYNGTEYDVYIKNGELTRINKDNGLRTGLKTSISGLSSQVPFFETPSQISAGLKSDNKLNKFEGDFVRNHIEPRLLQEFADWSDKDTDKKFTEHPVDYLSSETIKRDPKEFLDFLKVGVPYLRQQVGEKGSSNKKLTEIKVGTDVYELNNNQQSEREQYINEFNKEFAVDIASQMKENGKTNKDISIYVNEKALDYSKQMIIEKYQDPATEKIKLKMKNQ